MGGGQLSPIRSAMMRLAKGPQSLTMQIGEGLKAAPPAWDQLQAHTKEAVELASSLSQLVPSKGSKESWAKLTSAFSETMQSLDKAVQGKDKAAALSAHKTLSASCNACHQEHRAGPMMGFGAPGKGFGPPGKDGPMPPPGKGPPPGEPPQP
jgi:hypothetical protein